MNKKLIALAVAGACVAPTAMAQSANPVTLYGRIHVSAESVKATGAATAANNADNRTRMEDQASYLGVRGTEDLGGGLKAVFQLETGFAPDEASGTFANRNSGVGLQGGWGTFMMGRWDTPMKMSQTNVDPYGDVNIAAPSRVYLDQGNFRLRQGNSLMYWSPTMAGFDVKAFWSPNEGKTSTANPQMYGASLNYAKGPFYAAYSYEEHKDSITGVVTANSKETGNAFAASYQIGSLKLMGEYGEFKKETGGTSVKDKSYFLAAKYTMGKHNLIANYANAEQGPADCDQWAATYQYDFSKRTNLYVMYSEIDNSTSATNAAANMNCRFNGGTLGGSGADLKGFALAIKHVF